MTTENKAPDGGKEAPDGADASTKTREDLIPREEAKAAFAARDEAKQRARELEARLEEIESESAKTSGDLSKQFELKDAKIESLSKSLAEATEEIAKSKRQVLERDFSAAVLDGVPSSHQSLAREVLEARILRGQYELGPEVNMKQLASRAQKELSTSHPQLFEEGPVPSTKTPGVSLSADEIGSMNEIPRGEWADFARKNPDKARELIRKMG